MAAPLASFLDTIGLKNMANNFQNTGLFNWFESLKSATKTCLVQDGIRKVHYTFSDGKELVEEYDMKTNNILVRKWRKKTTLGGLGTWEFEIGENEGSGKVDADGIVESSLNPQFIRKDTRKTFEWRIRNLPYPLEMYSITVDSEQRCIVVRTANKKYFKKFNVPDLDRGQLPLEQRRIRFSHSNNTLIITYEKPPSIIEFEEAIRKEMKKMKVLKDGDVDCAPS